MIRRDHTEIKYNSRFETREQLNLPFGSFKDLPMEILDMIELNSNQFICLWDEAGDVLFVSYSIELLLGYTREKIIADDWSEIIAEPSIQYLKSKITELKPNELFKTQVLLNHKNGKQYWYSYKVRRTDQKRNDKRIFIAFWESIDNERRLIDVLVESEKMSVASQLAAGVVHEIRNPLTSIKGFIQLMESGLEGKQKYYDIMIEEIEKIETMATELLYISKPPDENKQAECLNQMISEVLLLFSEQAKGKGISLQSVIENKIIVHCNRSQMKQILINLVKNAIEAIEDSGHITIKVTESEGNLNIDVIDNGPGVPERLLDQLELPFFTTKEEGTGLGLMVSKQLVEQHEGELIIFINPDKGATFRIEIPQK